jgi:hypothetical protein
MMIMVLPLIVIALVISLLVLLVLSVVSFSFFGFSIMTQPGPCARHQRPARCKFPGWPYPRIMSGLTARFSPRPLSSASENH